MKLPEVENLTEAETLTEESSQAEDTAVDAYLDLFANEDAGGYTVTGAFADEPILKQLLSQNAAFAGFDAAGFYEITGDTREDLEQYQLNLVLADNANLYHYDIADGEFVKTPLEALFGEDQEKIVSLSSATNHWIVVHLRAAEAEKVDESASESEEGKAEESQEETSATEAETKEAETTKPTKAPETAAPTTTAHTHTWVPVTNTVHHDAVTRQVWKEDSAAWDENVLVQDAWDEPIIAEVDICNVCGYVYPIGATSDDYGYHALVNPGDGGGWYTEARQVGTTHHDAVYNTIHHEAVYQTVHHEATGHYETVVDQDAWDETVTTGYKCSGCGATK